MIFYLTFNDAPSGVYSSQVIDVVKFLDSHSSLSVRLVAFISIRNYSKQKKAIKEQLTTAIVVPMFPSVKNWKLNKYLLSILSFYYKPQSIIARSIFAVNLAFYVRDKKLTQNVCYDGRGAIAAEWKEYQLVMSGGLLDQISAMEYKAINASDFSIAVSHKLIEYWQQYYKYNSNNHTVIPCTLHSGFFKNLITAGAITEIKKSLDYKQDDIILIYSGSSAGWQSFEMLSNLLQLWLKQNSRVKVLFLAKPENCIQKLIDSFPDQVKCFWVDSSLMQRYLMIGDYGLLVREQSITNKVSSPVKFAEYLSCGLSVIISENLGDYTEFVITNKCGIVINELNTKDITVLQPVNIKQKEANKELATCHFSKYSVLNSTKYDQLLQHVK